MSEIRVDTISEKTSANGVSIDGLTIKDGGITATTGAIVFNEAGADLDFRVESDDKTHALFVDGGNNRVGFITAPDLGNVHIRVDDTGASSNNDADELVLEKNGACGLSILSANNADGNIFFGDDGDNDVGRIIYSHSNNNMTFRANATEFLRADEDGHVTMPKQPAFKAVPSSQQNNLSVNAWNTIVFGTENYDINNDFGNSNFTAPVTGKYILTVNLYLQDIDSAATSITCELHTSNDDYPVFVTMPGVDFNADMGFRAFNGAVLVDMDANDTASVRVYPEGGAAQTDVNVSSTYSGMLIG